MGLAVSFFRYTVGPKYGATLLDKKEIVHVVNQIQTGSMLIIKHWLKESILS